MTEEEKRSSDSEDSTEECEGSDLLKEYSGRQSPCYITVETEDGGIERIQVRANNDDDFSPPTSGAFFNSGEFSQVDNQDVESQFDITYKEKRSKSIIKELKKSARRRIISKHGDCNVHLYRVSKKRRKFIKDVFTTCVDMKWRYTLLAFAASFFISWLLFAVLWYVICLIHGDFEEEHLPSRQEETGWIPCVLATHNFASAFLFSVETQHTIGYGSRQTTEECPEAIILQCIQSVAGVIIQACMAGIVFAKLARPKQRSNTIMFSRNALITMRNGHLFLLFRVGNMRSSQLLEAHLRAQFVHKVYTKEGENIHFHQEELKVGTQLDGEEDRTVLLWPSTFSHKIDKHSPLWKLGPKQLLSSKFEIIVILEGIVEPTGNSVQARSSYLPNEILWGHRFENVVSYAKHKGVYAVDCSSINQVVPDDCTPRMSAKEISELKLRKASQLTSTRSRSSSTNHLHSINQLYPSKKLSQISQSSMPVSRISRVSAMGDSHKIFNDCQEEEEELASIHDSGDPPPHIHENSAKLNKNAQHSVNGGTMAEDFMLSEAGRQHQPCST